MSRQTSPRCLRARGRRCGRRAKDRRIPGRCGAQDARAGGKATNAADNADRATDHRQGLVAGDGTHGRDRGAYGRNDLERCNGRDCRDPANGPCDGGASDDVSGDGGPNCDYGHGGFSI
jgi:hypothetical protein